MELRQILLDAEPNVSIVRTSYARAHYARALAQARIGSLPESIRDIDIAIEWEEPLRRRYPLNFEHNHSVVQYRTLKIRVLRDLGDWEGIIDQIEALRPLQLTVESLTECIEQLEAYWERFPQYPLTLEWLADLYSRRASLIGNDDPKAVVRDREAAIETLKRLIREEPNEVKHQEKLLEATTEATPQD